MKTHGLVALQIHIFLSLVEAGGEWPQLLYPQGKSPQCPLDRRLGGPQSWSGWCRKEKNLDPIGTWILTALLCNPQPVAMLTALSWLLIMEQTHPQTTQKHPTKLLTYNRETWNLTNISKSKSHSIDTIFLSTETKTRRNRIGKRIFGELQCKIC
jgi:hypothetical protein